jgi:hypothetical protein
LHVRTTPQGPGSLWHVREVPTQEPLDWHLSVCVQALPSSQVFPALMTCAQTLPVQESVVQGFLSSHCAALVHSTQAPAVQKPPSHGADSGASWYWQLGGKPGTQVPFLRQPEWSSLHTTPSHCPAQEVLQLAQGTDVEAYWHFPVEGSQVPSKA